MNTIIVKDITNNTIVMSLPLTTENEKKVDTFVFNWNKVNPFFAVSVQYV